MGEIPRSKIPVIGPGHLEAIAGVLGDTDYGLSGTDIGHFLAQARIADTDPTITKRKRLYNALAHRLNTDQHSGAVLQFIKYAMDPARYAGRRQQFDDRRAALNVPLAMVGITLREDGRFGRVDSAATLTEAEQRADALRAKLRDRGVHAEVLRFCRAELTADNYFHAVLEATKSVTDKVRTLSGIDADGAKLLERALGGENPILKINNFSSESERGEQRGFVNLLTGMYGVFRNPAAHEAKIMWPISEPEALDLLVLASYAHRRLDAARTRQRPYATV